MKPQTEAPERYFFKYAFPCTFLKFNRGEITKKEYGELEKKFIVGDSPSKKELEKIYPFAFKMIKRLAKRTRRAYWGIDVIKEYWLREHNKIIESDEPYYKCETSEFKDSCKVHKAEVIEKKRNTIIVRYGNKKREVYNAIVPDAKKGNIVTIHFDYAIEKLK